MLSLQIREVRHLFSGSKFCKISRFLTNMTNTQAKKLTLVAFDFDHTLIEDNSDVFVQTLSSGGKIPEEIKKTYNSKNWIEFMNRVFKHLHEGGTSPRDILDHMSKISWTPGMKELLQYFVSKNHLYEAIIISDSNSVFINRILEVADISSAFTEVFTNAAKFEDNGLLKVFPYHHQDWCDLSTENMCKGSILESHIENRKLQGIEFEKVVYVGDGSNDFCPSIRLSESDVVFPRKEFALKRLLDKQQTGTESVPRNRQVVANIIPWETGQEIHTHLLNSLEPTT